MKTFINIISVFAVLLIAFASLAAADDSNACSRKSHGAAITNAIGKFCIFNHVRTTCNPCHPYTDI